MSGENTCAKYLISSELCESINFEDSKEIEWIKKECIQRFYNQFLKSKKKLSFQKLCLYSK